MCEPACCASIPHRRPAGTSFLLLCHVSSLQVALLCVACMCGAARTAWRHDSTCAAFAVSVCVGLLLLLLLLQVLL